MKIRWHLFIF